PSVIIDDYARIVRGDPSRPAFMNLGRGVADPNWVGRGSCAGRSDMYPDYVKVADVLEFVTYPVNESEPLEIVAKGIDQLRAWVADTKPVIGVIEAADINDTTRPTPDQIRSEVWMAIVHRASAIEYFCHRFLPTQSETDCLEDKPTADALVAINGEIASLAPVLNTPPIANGVTVTSSDGSIPVDTLLKRVALATYLFAVEMRGGTTTATFTLRDFPTRASAEVLGEGRSLVVNGGVLRDTFVNYGVHLYRITY